MPGKPPAPMSFLKPATPILGLLAFASSAHAVITTTVSGVYDEQVVRGNTVDASFSSAPSAMTGAGPAPTLLSVATFKTNVATAYAAGRGGVIHFDDVTGPLLTQSEIRAQYGLGNSSTMVITNGGGTATWSMDMGSTAAIAATPISGGNYLRMGNPTIGFTFQTPVEAFGFTALGRLDARTLSIQINYNNGTSVTYGAYTVGASGSSSTGFTFSDTSANDTFFGFQAPTGLSITRFTLVAPGSGNGNNPTLDDIGFIIPEPSAVVLSAMGALGLMARRRRC